MLRFIRDLPTALVPVILTALLLLAIGYLLGSIPSGYLAGRWCKGIDLRELGSGSTGATNVLRQVGKGPALVVFVIDVATGAAAVLIAGSRLPGSDWIQVLAGLTALAGHIWPVWLGFKGGKAVATGLGMFLGLAWPVAWPVSASSSPRRPCSGSCRSPAWWPPSACPADGGRHRRLRQSGGGPGGDGPGDLAPPQQFAADRGRQRTQDRPEVLIL